MGRIRERVVTVFAADYENKRHQMDFESYTVKLWEV